MNSNENQNQKKGNTILLTVIAIATLLVAIVGATFAYFTATISGNDKASSIIVKTAQIGQIVFQDGDEIKLENALPGASTQKTFSISASDATVPIKYGIKLNIATNSFTATTGSEGNDLVYSLSSQITGGDSSSGQAVTKVDDGAITQPSGSMYLGQGTLGVGETHKYTFTIKFKETGSDQNSNQNQSFNGSLEVTTGDESSETYYNDTYKEGTTTKPEAQ